MGKAIGTTVEQNCNAMSFFGSAVHVQWDIWVKTSSYIYSYTKQDNHI